MQYLSAFDSRRNSLNVLRLVFAGLVVVSHTWLIAGFGPEPTWRGYTMGTVAVYGFFAISGYLIVQSRTHLSGREYLWHRFLRIFPGYWVCLVVIAVVIAPLAALRAHGYSIADAGRFVVVNSALAQRQWGIGSTLADAPFRDVWDGSLWTLLYEVLCYVAVAIFAWFGLLRRRGAITAGVAGLVVITAVLSGPLNSRYVLGVDPYLMATLGLVFAAGALAALWAERIPMRLDVAVISALLVIGLLTASSHYTAPLIGFPLAYLVLWVGGSWRTDWCRRNDLSYGVYIYAFPVQQLLVVYGLAKLGLVPLMAIEGVVIVALAALSWRLVEHPALRLRHRLGQRSGANVTGTPSPTQAPSAG